MNPNQPEAPPPARKQSFFDGSGYRKGCGALGVVMALFSGCGVVAFVTDIVTQRKPDELSAALSLSFLFAGTAVVGLLIARHYFRKEPARPNAQLENRLLQVAYAHRARLTVPQVALHCQVTIEESREVLERMVSQGVAVPQVDDDGTITYVFDDLLPPPGSLPTAQGQGGLGARPEED
jgi:hypothetical protein